MDQLGLNLPTLVAQLINFLILLFLLRLFLWKPITGMLDERQRRIKESAGGGRAHERADPGQRARHPGTNRRCPPGGPADHCQLQQIANRVQEEGRTQAQTESETMLARARSEIQLERDNAIAELRKEFADITVQAAEKVIGQSLDRSSHQRSTKSSPTPTSRRLPAGDVAARERGLRGENASRSRCPPLRRRRLPGRRRGRQAR